MYFEPVKKTYYRFPSQNSIRNFDEKYHYPQQTYASGENIRDDSQSPKNLSLDPISKA